MALTDRFGRAHTYLRVSVTDRCNFRCVYCMPAEGFALGAREDLLSYEELETLVGVFAELGIRRVRLTGGEPTLRRDIVELVGRLAALPGIEQVALTTNALKLGKLAAPLAEAGLSRVNVSLDSLDAERFAKLTRGAPLAPVLAGIDAALAAGLKPLKVNAVVLRGENDVELEDLVRWAAGFGGDVVLRFIEYMPFEARWHHTMPASEIRARLERCWALEPLGLDAAGGPSDRWRVPELGITLGFISPLSEKFCGSCNRLRLMSDGHLRTCLSDDATPSLRDLTRAGATREELAVAIRTMVMGKREGHGCQVEGGTAFEGVMTRVGG